jgi:hypothetical protein
MAKITLTLCDVRPCNYPAEREFEVNGQKVYVCGESCFVKYWSREYARWKGSPYNLRATTGSGLSAASLEDTATLNDPNNSLGSAANLQLIKPL